ncbi:Ig-like domain-containing protein [Mucilaginibacter gossypii]|uniref:Ig-like domain-containing protein n=1 Tax=Mucilaginibacter gossypii TaxID=551996 RepID=A0A1G8J8W1_9SPHI|nr:Ig-like domain-containing protein [Mucilaginibacter gossypii]SDI27532.1 Ig-like domain-containing protein [Mucilaginibacter gossypii]
MTRFFPILFLLLINFIHLNAATGIINHKVLRVGIKTKPDTCSSISTLPCSALTVTLPFKLSFDASVPNTIIDRNGQGTGFTTVNKYSGVRLAADGNPSNPVMPGYEASKITVMGGSLQLVTNKGIDILTNNNQLNVLGVKVNPVKKLQIDVKVINPVNGAQAQQAGIWFGLNDKTYLKLDVSNNKIELRREINDVTSSISGIANPDQRITPAITALSAKTVSLRLVIDSVAKTAEGFYSTDGLNFLSAGAGYAAPYISIDSTGIINHANYAGIFGTHRNASGAVTYSFDDFAVTDIGSNSKVLSFSQNILNISIIKKGLVYPQTVNITSNVALPAGYTLTKTDANWLNLPQPKNNLLTFDANAIDSNTNAGSYQAVVTCAATGYKFATLLVNLNVVDGQFSQPINVNFQDPAAIPPVNYMRDYGQGYALRTAPLQGSGLEFGWRRKSDGSAINITGNGRNRNNPEDVLLATLIHMQANTISGSFSGTKVESFWEIKVPNGIYDVTASVGDGYVGSAPEFHSLNIEGVNVINRFAPVGKEGSIGRFKAVTSRIIVNDEKLTITADGGTNTKINYVNIVPYSLSSYLFWGKGNQNLIVNAGSKDVSTFSIPLGSSNNQATSYAVSASYTGASSNWLTFTPSQTGVQPEVFFNYSATKNLPIGNYKAVITAKAPQFTSSTFIVQINVVDSLRPYVISSSPANGATKVPLNLVSIAANNLHVPVAAGYHGGVDNSTITNNTVKLFKLVDTSYIEVPGVVQGTGGGDAISISPSATLDPNAIYKFVITSGVKSYANIPFVPYEMTFTTDAAQVDSSALLNAQFTKVPIAGTQNKKYSSLAIGPDGKFYALRLDGTIERYLMNHTDGSLTLDKTMGTLVAKYGERTAIGLTFAPTSTSSNVIVWVSHSSGGLTAAPSYDGNISKLWGDSLQFEQLVITKLPRSTRDHMVNSLAFGPDNALYICQGSNSSAGSYDNDWQRNETLLSGAILRLDLTKLNSFVLPLNVQTTSNQMVINAAPGNTAAMSDGTYNPYSTVSPLTIYASGVRNAFDMIWHSNGQLYLPTNGSGGGGNSPASVAGTHRPDGSFYHGPAVAATVGVKVQNDWLFRVNPDLPVGFFGHPNPLRGEYVINRGYPDNPLYSPTVNPDSNYRAAYSFGLNNSPDGALEYKSNTFNGALKGKLLVCRFSGGGDIIVMEPGAMTKTAYSGTNDHIYDIVKVTTGSSNSGLIGMSGFANPLDIVEDAVNGNLYVNEFNWNNNTNLISQITLLKVSSPAPPMPVLAVSAVSRSSVNDNDDKEYQITLINKGDGVLKIKDIRLSGRDAGRFAISNIQLPSERSLLVLSKNRSLSFKVNSKTKVDGNLNALLKVTSIDDTTKIVQIDNSAHVDSVIIKKSIDEFKSVAASGDERVLQAYPNPITNGIANVKLSHFKPNEPVSIYVFDMTGKKLKTNKAQVDEKGSLSTKFELEQRGGNKFYIIRAVYKSGYKYAKIIVDGGN